MNTAAVSSAIILAGGLGTRLRSCVPDLPKPMAPVDGRPFLAHLMDRWIGQGVHHFVLSVGYRCEAITDHFGPRYRGATLDYAVETVPLGTGGALRLAARRLPAQEPALLLNGDTYFDVDLAALQAQACALDAQWCLALFESPDPARYMGVGVEDDGRITALRSPQARWANGGVYWFIPAALRAAGQAPAGQAESLENDVLPQLLARGQRFAALRCAGDFIDIGVPHDYRRAASVLPATPPQENCHVLAP